jgi:hypothetical protein
VVKRVIKNFKSYLVEEAKEVYFTFGRMNPPTIGHGKVLETIAKKAGGADWKVYVSQSVGPKDPLSYSDKVKHLRKMFPKYGRNIMVDKGVKNVFDIAAKLYDQGYKRITMVVGEDRLREFEVLLNKYNGKKARHGFYNFESINIVSAGRRDPDAEGVEGMSASKQRANAKENDYQSFTQGVPKGMSDKDTRRLFNDVRKGMGLKEETSFKRHIEMPTVSETREQFVKGELFELGDTVVIKESEEVGVVSHLGANYVIVESGDRKMRKWLDAVELVEKKLTPAEIKKREEIAKAMERENPDMPMDKKMAIATATAKRVAEKAAVQDPDIKDKEGTQPKKYYAGLKKGTKDKRDAHFKKHGKKADDDESAYKPAPGDKGAKTKPSKYTKAFKDMYEEVSQKQLNDLEKFADRLLKKFDVDVEFTRHFADRMNDKRNKPAITVAELQRVFKKIAKNKAKNIRQNPDSEAVIKDLQMDLNLPVVIKYDRNKDEFEVVNKTIMRKKDFKTTSKTITTEENGAGDEGTDKLVKKYKKDTPLEERKFIDFTNPVFGDILDKLVNGDIYKKVIRKYLDARRKNPKQGQALLVKIARQYGVPAKQTQNLFFKLLDKGALPKHLDWRDKAFGEDAVQQARDAIAREKEQDKAKHDRILDRARLARAKAKNRETK